jgi:phage/plasmid-associated DNA primase
VAGKEGRKESDQIGRFIRERCVAGEFAQVKARGLYLAYKQWAEEVSERLTTETAFGSRMTLVVGDVGSSTRKMS